MTKKLKLGVVGAAGNIFRIVHRQCWLRHEEVEIVAVCDINEEQAEEEARDLGGVRHYMDVREMIAKEQLDMVDICTPNAYHAEMSIAALAAGIHVLCEKPDALNEAEALAMMEAARESGKILMTIRNNRFRPASRFLKDFAASGAMGDIYTGRCGWIRRRGIPGKGGWFTTKALSGGGPLIDLGVHFIDLAVWLMGSPRPVSVSGAAYRKFADNDAASDSVHSKFGQASASGTFDVEDLACGFIRFENGATLQIEFSWASNIEKEENFVELRGSKAGFRFRNDELKIFTETEGRLADLVPKLPESQAGHEENIRHFVDCVQHRCAPLITPEENLNMMGILYAVYKSAELGREVRLD